MNIRKHAALSVVALAMGLPMVAQANTLYHSAPNEAGFTEHPSHWNGTKTRAQVNAEIEAARKDGSLAQLQRGAPVPPVLTGPAKTRQQVIDELLNEPAEERRARLALQRGR